MPFLSVQCNFPWARSISRGYICKPQEGREGKKLASANPKELQSFWGLVSYYCHFILKFAAIAKCLYQLVGPANHQKSKKNKTNNECKAELKSSKQTFQWTDKHQEAFDLLKACLTSAPVLGYPDFSHPFVTRDGGIITRTECCAFSKGWNRNYPCNCICK